MQTGSLTRVATAASGACRGKGLVLSVLQKCGFPSKFLLKLSSQNKQAKLILRWLWAPQPTWPGACPQGSKYNQLTHIPNPGASARCAGRAAGRNGSVTLTPCGSQGRQPRLPPGASPLLAPPQPPNLALARAAPGLAGRAIHQPPPLRQRPLHPGEPHQGQTEDKGRGLPSTPA